jgi:predicted GIY-YIG superfamily endonuclease
MDDFKKHIYWVESCENHEDWFVVGADQFVAEKYFCDFQGYHLDHVSSEEICVAVFEDDEDIKQEAYFPSHEMLLKHGFEVIADDEPRIFWKAGRKFCQGNIIQRIHVEIGNKQSGVYILEVRDSSLFKIGVTKDIEKRLSQLQTSNPYEFYLWGFYVTAKHRELENLLHKKFHLKRYKREWFKLSHDELTQACSFAADFIGKPYIRVTQSDIDKMEKETIQNHNSHLPF